MALTRIQKAALLLTTLDQVTAMELLKGQSQEVIRKVAMELSRWDGKSKQDPQKLSMVAHEFFSDLTKTQSGGLNIKSFIGSLMQDTADKTGTIQSAIQQTAIQTDPYIMISDASAAHLAAAVENEPPQVIAIVLSEVSPKLSTDVLTRLPEEKAQLTVWRMTQGKEVPGKTKQRIGQIICKRLIKIQSTEDASAQDTTPTKTLRKVALVLTGLQKEKRDAYLKKIQEQDDGTASTVRALMVTWEDIPKIEDKSLQQFLRNMEAAVLAKAMRGADAVIAEKINSNISERMNVMIEEEASLMGNVRKKDILEAREEVVKPLREALEAEELSFIEEEGVE
jgi:flagellar motor switch protein FliG